MEARSVSGSNRVPAAMAALLVLVALAVFFGVTLEAANEHTVGDGEQPIERGSQRGGTGYGLGSEDGRPGERGSTEQGSSESEGPSGSRKLGASWAITPAPSATATDWVRSLVRHREPR